MSLRKQVFLLLGKRYYVKNIKGLMYLLDMRNRVDRHIDAFSEYEKPQIDFFLSKLKSSNCSVFVDIGSHWGYYSLLFADESCFDQAKIYAFEPDRFNRYQLYANLFLNKKHDRIEVFEYAISSKEGELRFHHYEENNRGRSCVADDGEMVVKTSRLDTVLPIMNEVLGIKIDVEGHELDVIAGMLNTLKNNTCILQIESFPDVLPKLQKLMTESGYSMINTISFDHYFSNENKILSN